MICGCSRQRIENLLNLSRQRSLTHDVSSFHNLLNKQLQWRQSQKSTNFFFRIFMIFDKNISHLFLAGFLQSLALLPDHHHHYILHRHTQLFKIDVYVQLSIICHTWIQWIDDVVWHLTHQHTPHCHTRWRQNSHNLHNQHLGNKSAGAIFFFT